MTNITEKSIIVIPASQEINDTEIDNLEIEQPEQENNQQADKETEEQEDGVVIVNDDVVTTIQHSSKDGGDEESENPDDVEDTCKTETLIIDKEKELMKQNENQSSSKENIDSVQFSSVQFYFISMWSKYKKIQRLRYRIQIHC